MYNAPLHKFYITKHKVSTNLYYSGLVVKLNKIVLYLNIIHFLSSKKNRVAPSGPRPLRIRCGELVETKEFERLPLVIYQIPGIPSLWKLHLTELDLPLNLFIPDSPQTGSRRNAVEAWFL
jgi:hypothetical protein